jgi:lactoylglutathione lyase
MSATLEKAFGYQGNNLNLPVADVDASVPFYETALGFTLVARAEEPQRTAVLARDSVQIGLVENGGDPAQNGCAFHVTGLDALFAELNAKGLRKSPADIGIEHRDGAPWRVFYVVAPDGLCYWFGEKQG